MEARLIAYTFKYFEIQYWHDILTDYRGYTHNGTETEPQVEDMNGTVTPTTSPIPMTKDQNYEK